MHDVSCGFDPDCRIVKLVRAMRKGWLKKQDEKPPEKPPVYLLWQDDGLAADHTQAGEPRMPAWGTIVSGLVLTAAWVRRCRALSYLLAL